jgi:hypothetical protein
LCPAPAGRSLEESQIPHAPFGTGVETSQGVHTTLRKAVMKRATPSTRLRTYDVLPHEGDAAQRWEMHQHGGREHTYFGTQREAIAAAREQARTHHPAKVVLHAPDGFAYREFTF